MRLLTYFYCTFIYLWIYGYWGKQKVRHRHITCNCDKRRVLLPINNWSSTSGKYWLTHGETLDLVKTMIVNRWRDQGKFSWQNEKSLRMKRSEPAEGWLYHAEGKHCILIIEFSSHKQNTLLRRNYYFLVFIKEKMNGKSVS